MVTALERDPAGRLWVGTTKGLARLDGTNIDSFAGGVVPDAGPGGHDGRLVGNAKLGKVAPSRSAATESMSGRKGHAATKGASARWHEQFCRITTEHLQPVDRGHRGRLDQVGRVRVRTRFFDFGKQDHTMLFSSDTHGELRYLIHQTFEDAHGVGLPNVLETNQWVHLAAVSGPGGMKLYLNGDTDRSEDPYPGSISAIGNNDHNYLGRSVWEENAFLRGDMDEVRVWKVARTEEQIRANMSRNLSGQEDGLIGLWNFDNVTNGVVKDLSPGGHDGLLKGNATVRTDATLDRIMRTPMKTETVLDLDGKNSFVELPPNIFNYLTEATVEAWVKWGNGQAMRFFNYGAPDHDLGVGKYRDTLNAFAVIDAGKVAGIEDPTPAELRRMDACSLRHRRARDETLPQRHTGWAKPRPRQLRPTRKRRASKPWARRSRTGLQRRDR